MVAGVGGRCVLHGESFRMRDARGACGRGMRPQGVGRFEPLVAGGRTCSCEVFY